jgi:carbonic anhydrase/acetyltransferase-like protein (isoleucine patch superfamily)
MPCIEDGASVWFGAVHARRQRAHHDRPRQQRAGRRRAAYRPGLPLTLAAEVLVGHQAMLHGCSVGEGSLIGIQAVVMNGAVIGRECLIGAGALVPEGKVIPDRSLVLGSPGKVVRQLSDQEAAAIRLGCANYAERAQRYRRELQRLPD